MGKAQPLGQTSNVIHRTKFKAEMNPSGSGIYSISSIHEKIDIWPTVDLHTSYPYESDG